MKRHLVLTHGRAPGDVVVLTALARDVALAYPELELSVYTPCKALWDHNPYLVRTPTGRSVERLRLTYGRHLRRPDYPHHFLTAFHEDFRLKTGLEVPLTLPRPDLHLSAEERQTPLVAGRYWVVVAGGKTDFTTKQWSYARWQQTVDRLRGCGLRLVQAGATDRGPPPHKHPSLDGVLSLVGRTSFRQLLQLIHHAEGVVCSITLAMHAAAALEKPCVVIAGGREEATWEAYVNTPTFGPVASGKVAVEHRYLHTIGLLPCCRELGCWKSKVLPAEDPKRKSVCKQPVRVENEQAIPECLRMISVNHVVEAVMSYYKQGILPPIGPEPVITYPAGPPLPPPEQLYVPAAPVAPPPPAPAVRDEELFDHPAVGGKFTVFWLGYGDYFDLHRRGLDALLRTLPEGRAEVRLGSNALGDRSQELVRGLLKEGRVAAHYEHRANDKKYPVMREMFHDAGRPVATPWLLWLDDDTLVDRNPRWLALLAESIIAHAPKGCAAFGPRRYYSLKAGQRDWIKRASWYRGRPFQDARGREAPNGSCVHFTSGSFWALSVEAMKKCDIPDVRLAHNGGDVIQGEQLHQHGYLIKDFSGRKEIVHWSSVPRRGLSEKHPGL